METKKTNQNDGAHSMTTISKEEENYVRMSLLLSGISRRAFRAFFDKEFDPVGLDACLKKAINTLNSLRKKNIINQAQFNLLFPRKGSPDSKMFDVSLMSTLLINLAKIDIYDKLPLKEDRTPSADLGRIKYYRNLIAHNEDEKIDTTLFSTAWKDIIEAVGRLGDKNMIDECEKLRYKILEQSTVTVPWNIRVQINQTMEEWKTNNATFVETNAAIHVLKCIQENSCVTITASSGVGKTATLQHVGLKMNDEGFDVLPVTNIHDIVKFYNPDHKTLFVMDDFCGTYSINQYDIASIESIMKRLKVLFQNKLTKIIVACRLQVYQDDKFEILEIFRTCVCNLQSENLCLTETEKKSIADLYLETKSSEIIEYFDLYDCFPLLCKLYNENPALNITDFFKNPFSVYEAEIDKLHTRGLNKKVCALALCVIFNNSLKEEWLIDEIDTLKKTMIENTCEACKLNKGTSRLKLRDALKTLENTFIKEVQGKYKTIHDKLFDFLSFYFCKKMIQCCIKNAHPAFIMQRFLLERKDDMDQFITVVPPKYHDTYIERMIKDWSEGNVQFVFNNINMMIQKFRQKFKFYLDTQDEIFQEKLALTCDVDSKDTVLIQCCYLDDIPLVQWCIDHKVDVNQCRNDGICPMTLAVLKDLREVVKVLLDNKADINKSLYDGRSALYLACFSNHIEILMLLLDNKADINKCANDGISPLCIACQLNHIKIVKLLLDNKADINKCMDNDMSPLYIACQNNHIEIVKVLLQNKADTQKGIGNGISPLYIACNNNHKEIVKLLLDNKADVDKCAHNGISPLNIASHNNHIEIVKMLLDSKADINRCEDNKSSPLFVACYNNHIEIVTLLLDNNADINQCDENGASPLFVACQNNHIETVKALLDMKADKNKCNNTEASPLYIACQNCNIDIVKVLLDSKADINKCINMGSSPLFFACQENHIEIVKLLLDNKANMNKCRDNGSSPLYIACQNNHLDIVKLLLNNKADMNKCRENGYSPLLIACQHNRLEIVKVLLDNKADVNKCANNGVSPLFISCMNNHKEIVKNLLHKSAIINHCTPFGSSPLFVAFMRNHFEIVKMLEDKGANCINVILQCRILANFIRSK